MGQYCCINGCKNTSKKDEKAKIKRSYHRLPVVINDQDENVKKLSEERRSKWIHAINKKDLNVDSSATRVCTDHFINSECLCLRV